ncbi:Gp15 family bacteriophage protein [Alkalicoccobacillus gibsonii]|uniref:Gp15 family bacteriophage protein n=1 Tax=Alkalicoccobacillus gibsonii TaxID=79881 RepID=UPI003F7BDF4E
MKLNDPLVRSFNYEDFQYDIDLAFDNILDVFDVLSDKELRDFEKADISISLLVGKVLKLSPEEDGYRNYVIDLWNYIFDQFIHTETRKIIEYDRKGDPIRVLEDEETEKLLDLEQDSEFIFASFKQAYGMNLYEEQGKLQWREFQSLLNGLPSDTIMKRIIEIRAWKPSKHDSPDYKQSMEKMKRRFALHDVEGEEEE